MAILITSNGIEWTIEGAPENGVYISGDPWVKAEGGSITISAISPQSGALGTTTDSSGATITRIGHGTDINPAWGGPQGLDNARKTGSLAYNASENAGLPGGNPVSAGNPLVVAAGSSVVSVRSTDAGSSRPNILNAAVLTVVSATPPANAFRPPYIGTDKTHYWLESQLNYGILPSLPPTSSTPPLATVEAMFAQFNLTIGGTTGNDQRNMSPKNQMSSYGGSQAANRTIGLHSLCLNYTQGQKRLLLVRMVQIGIDIYGAIKAGRTYYDLGALNCGHKGVMVMAGLVLNDSNILAYCDGTAHHVFAEDRQTFYVQQSDVGRVMYTGDGRPRETYTQAMVGLPEWGEQHTKQQNRDGSNWNTYYRNQNFDQIVAQANAITLMGGRTTWNWPPFFDYAKRIIEVEGNNPTVGNRTGFFDGGIEQLQTFTLEMWNAYSSLGDGAGGTPPDPAVTPPAISPTTRPFLGSAEVTISTPFPLNAVIRYTLDGSDPTAESTLYTGPFTILDTTNVKARGFAPDYFDSAVSSALFTHRYFTATTNWQSLPTTTQAGTAIPVSFKVAPSFVGLDGVVGVGGVIADGFSKLACIIQFATNGTVNARNGSAYQSVTPFTYSAGLQYQVDMVVNTVAKTYSATITPPSGTPVVIAQDFAFRTEQAAISAIEYFSSYVAGSNNLVLQDIYVGSFTPPTPQAPIPVITPASGPYLDQVEVGITVPLEDATLYYTLDGSTPTTSSQVYTGPFVRPLNTTVKALAVKDGYLDSLVATASFLIDEFTATSDDFENLGMGERITDIQIQFDATPSSSGMDGRIGVGVGAISDITDMAVDLRFGPTGQIEARDGNADAADVSVPYVGATVYSFVLTINLALKTYGVSVTPSGGSPVVLADNFAFRTEQSNAPSLAFIGGSVVTEGESIFVDNIVVSPTDLSVPPRRIIRRYVIARGRRRR